MHYTYTIARTVMVLSFGLLLGSCARAPKQTVFASPDEAAKALQEALKADSPGRLKEIFGAAALEAVASGDPTADRNDREVVALAMEQSSRWAPLGEGRKELIVGEEQWPFPVPLVKQGDGWVFDSKAGTDEILARRIGRNEMSVIGLCRDYVGAQREYAARPHDGKPAGRYAKKIRSSPGQQDGLYWNVRESGEPFSPLGDLVAEAELEGYSEGKPATAPFWGYHFRILDAQGEAGPGGKKSYLDGGEMTAGFAMVAHPAKYGHSGVMTFIVGPDGVVYERDLGPQTGVEATAIKEYNPDSKWKRVELP